MANFRVKGRTYDYKAEIATIGAGAGQITFNPQQTMGDYVAETQIAIAPAAGATNQDIGRFTRFQFSAAGVPIFTWTLDQLRAYVERFSRSNWVTPLTETTITIPWCLLDAPTLYDADACQFPLGAGMSVQIQYGANGGGGGAATGSATIMMSHSFATREPEFYPIFKSDQMNIQAGPVGGIGAGLYPFVEPGEVRAITFPTTGIHEMRLQLSGELVVKLPGPANLSAPANLIRETQQLRNGPVSFSPLCFATPFGLSAGYERSFLALDVANSWAGPANELGIYAIRSAGAALTSR
jgi:hypothetical protein